jgi:SHS2 domain-containing protein
MSGTEAVTMSGRDERLAQREALRRAEEQRPTERVSTSESALARYLGAALNPVARPPRQSELRSGMSGGDVRRGHRTVAHTADLRVEAWAPSRELCIAEAVLGTVAAFVDTSSARVVSARRHRLDVGSDEDLLVAVLNEVIYLMDTIHEIPVNLDVTPRGDGVDVWFAMADAGELAQVGAVPKGVSLHELRFGRDRRGWSCSVTVDV